VLHLRLLLHLHENVGWTMDHQQFPPSIFVREEDAAAAAAGGQQQAIIRKKLK
jgi:hypothetical protein